ncbi:MAG TPA: SigB/SigF/SigG family RNA polymerase sigma factor [Armatimonadetes bacterium]|nr:SigB/SigF/SigG family RNA polymerase sigma factor [Armatimonadota bacterium]
MSTDGLPLDEWQEVDTTELFRELRRLQRGGSPRYEELRTRLIEMHLSLVQSIARRFANRGEPLEDLVQQGIVALINAVDRYDPNKGTKFSTYAMPTILGEIKRYFRDKGWAMKVPRRLQELNLAANRAIETLSQRLDRSPTYEEIAREIGASVEDTIAALEMGQAYELISLEGDLHPEEEGTRTTLDGVGTVDQGLENFDQRAMLEAAIASLEPREQLIIRYRYFEDLSQTEVAARLGISQMHVSRLQRRALRKLREFLTEG